MAGIILSLRLFRPEVALLACVFGGSLALIERIGLAEESQRPYPRRCRRAGRT